MQNISNKKSIKLITHNGSFHYDELLATALLLEIFPDAEIIRTREQSIIETGDIVYDVGREYDAAQNKFDHHQKTFNSTFSSKYNIKMSSAGLIFKHFGSQLFEKFGLLQDSELYCEIQEKMYEEIFLSADAIDNGYDIFGEIKPRTVADVVRTFNVYTDKDNSSRSEDSRFRNALKFVQLDFKNYLNYLFTDYLVAYSSLYDLLKNLDEDIFITEEKFSIDLIYDINKKLNKDIKFVIFKNNQESRIMTLPIEKGKFGIKYPLHTDWRGLSGEKLTEISGIPGCIFVHATGFTGGNLTTEGALEMCYKSLDNLKAKK